jgi:hypothetical protein
MNMPRPILALMFALSCAGLAGCSETYQRLDGITPAAGDAIASNTVMQMVDPWQYGVQDTDLKVPADRGTADQASDSSDAAPSTPSTGGGGSTTGGY